MGYHVRHILERTPKSSHVVVVEPAEACLSRPALGGDKHSLHQWVRDERLHFLTHHDPRLTPVHLADRLSALRQLSIKMVTHIPSTLTDEEFYRTLAAEIPVTFPASIQRHLNTIDQSLDND